MTQIQPSARMMLLFSSKATYRDLGQPFRIGSRHTSTLWNDEYIESPSKTNLGYTSESCARIRSEVVVERSQRGNKDMTSPIEHCVENIFREISTRDSLQGDADRILGS
ncbi:hypothetical protein [Burkholderia sp. BE17]|uniref:hypothetical protein n=1 Tax=Burkholderia sp. BE17 TaxID=2656644 RepID=UPI00128BE623|nr:hypothetical protein [Burkholderia sp. BE17]MPV65170.1 hypothetical protein [Burkholderia sp. BE17]